MKKESLSKKEIIKLAVQEYLDTDESERSAAVTARKYGINRKTIINRVKDMGLGHMITQHHNKVKFDNTVFEKIDTEEKAYWLGFMYADGYTSANNNKVVLSISKNDESHLQKYIEFLKYSKPYKLRKNGFKKDGTQLYMVEVNIGDDKLYQDIVRCGCIPNKSLTLKFPDKNIFDNESLIRHFVRGYIDGDGSLGLYQGRWKSKVEHVQIIGTKDFLEGIQTTCGIKGYLRLKHPETGNQYTYILKYTNLKAFQVAKFFYENSNIYLERKYNIYVEMCRSKIGQKR